MAKVEVKKTTNQIPLNSQKIQGVTPSSNNAKPVSSASSTQKHQNVFGAASLTQQQASENSKEKELSQLESPENYISNESPTFQETNAQKSFSKVNSELIAEIKSFDPNKNILTLKRPDLKIQKQSKSLASSAATLSTVSSMVVTSTVTEFATQIPASEAITITGGVGLIAGAITWFAVHLLDKKKTSDVVSNQTHDNQK